MKVFWRIEDYDGKPCALSVGIFDGVHKGHQRLLQQLSRNAKQRDLPCGVLTFHPHPAVYFNKPGQLLTTIHERIERFALFPLDFVVVVPFDATIANLPPKTYIQTILVEKLRARYLLIGYDHRFGKDRKGSISTLRRYAAVYGYEVEEFPPQTIESVVVKSTLIRQALLQGTVQKAQQWLGYPYMLKGIVIKGQQLGRTLGYPTANLDVPKEKLIPKKGVYIALAQVKQQLYKAMVNIGTRPTIAEKKQLHIEAHLLNLRQNLYHQSLTLYFLDYLREEKRFSDLNALKKQLQQDEAQTLRFFASQSSISSVK